MSPEEIINRMNAKLETFAEKLSLAYDAEGEIRYQLNEAKEENEKLKEELNVLKNSASTEA